MKLTFDLSYNTTPKLVLNPSELLRNYMFGIPICNSQGLELTDDIIEKRILAAQQWIEGILYIKFSEQIIRETSNFVRQEWNGWAFTKTSYNVKYPLQLEGYYNKVKQVGYPADWLTIRFEQSSLTFDEDHIFRQVHIVPSGSTGNPSSGGVVYNGSTPFALFLNLAYIPNYWITTYITGFQKVPTLLIDMVGKLASIQLLAMLGEIAFGVGQSSYSISLDGLSQSTTLLKSATNGIYHARLTQYQNDIFGTNNVNGTLEAMKAKYRGLVMDCL